MLFLYKQRTSYYLNVRHRSHLQFYNDFLVKRNRNMWETSRVSKRKVCWNLPATYVKTNKIFITLIIKNETMKLWRLRFKKKILYYKKITKCHFEIDIARNWRTASTFLETEKKILDFFTRVSFKSFSLHHLSSILLLWICKLYANCGIN